MDPQTSKPAFTPEEIAIIEEGTFSCIQNSLLLASPTTPTKVSSKLFILCSAVIRHYRILHSTSSREHQSNRKSSNSLKFHCRTINSLSSNNSLNRRSKRMNRRKSTSAKAKEKLNPLSPLSVSVLKKLSRRGIQTRWNATQCLRREVEKGLVGNLWELSTKVVFGTFTNSSIHLWIETISEKNL